MPGFTLAASDLNDPYTISDVVTVTTKEVDPIPAAADDEYTEYTIVLKDGTVRVAKLPSMVPWPLVEKVFRETGYTGPVKELLAHR